MNTKIKILAIDDDLVVRKILTDTLGDDFNFIIAADIDEFYQRYAEMSPDIVMLDMHFPSGNGIDVCRDIKSKDKMVYVLIVSSDDKNEVIQEAYEAGADDYIRKPFIPNEISKKIELIVKSVSYRGKLQNLLFQQKRTSESIYKLTKIINKNRRISDRSNLFMTLFQVADFIKTDYSCIGVLEDEGYKVSEHKPNAEFKPIAYKQIHKLLKVFKDPYLDNETVEIKRKSSPNVFCHVRKIYFNGMVAGYIVLQKNVSFDKYMHNLLTLYLDFVNLKGVDIDSDLLLKEEIKKERHEINKVRSIQVSLLPDFKEIEKFDIASTFIPMEEISGDFFDGFFVNESTYQVIVCDVSGHGIASSYVGSSIRGILRSTDTKKKKPAEIVSFLNKQIFQSFENVYYFSTLVLCQLDIDTGDVTIVSAGHPPCYFYEKKTNEYRELENTGPLVGLMEDAEYSEIKFTMEKDDSFLIYTDGISESTPPDSNVMYGEEKLFRSFQENCDLSAVEMVHAIIGNVYEYNGYNSLDDDVTLLAIKRDS